MKTVAAHHSGDFSNTTFLNDITHSKGLPELEVKVHVYLTQHQ